MRTILHTVFRSILSPNMVLKYTPYIVTNSIFSHSGFLRLNRSKDVELYSVKSACTNRARSAVLGDF